MAYILHSCHCLSGSAEAFLFGGLPGPWVELFHMPASAESIIQCNSLILYPRAIQDVDGPACMHARTDFSPDASSWRSLFRIKSSIIFFLVASGPFSLQLSQGQAGPLVE